jgi:hypothetical protein
VIKEAGIINNRFSGDAKPLSEERYVIAAFG